MVEKRRVIVMLVVFLFLICMPILADTDSTYSGVVSLSLPYSVDFDIVIFDMEGFVTSPDYEVVNDGEEPVIVSFREAFLQTEDADDYAVSMDEVLPENGSNIYIEMISSNGNVFVFPPFAEDTGIDLYLAGGESASFHFRGVVNEYGKAWSETEVIVSINYSINPIEEFVNGGAGVPFTDEEADKGEIDSGDDNAEAITEPEVNEDIGDIQEEITEGEAESNVTDSEAGNEDTNDETISDDLIAPESPSTEEPLEGNEVEVDGVDEVQL
jgi:hypothetical protein